jgi:elongation factor P hydroxylase
MPCFQWRRVYNVMNDQEAVLLARLIHLFDALFFQTHHTRLVNGLLYPEFGGEPLYLPVGYDGVPYARIVFAHGYFSSALHEVAHWCIAGGQRRQQVDFGYWYVPDGRSIEQQEIFQKVEVKPQSLEWIFHRACGRRFCVSIDNLSGPADTFSAQSAEAFKQAVQAQTIEYLQKGLPERARLFSEKLAEAFGGVDSLISERYNLSAL